MNFIESLNSRKLTLTYLGLILSVGVSVWYTMQIESVDTLLPFLGSDTKVDLVSLISFQNNYNATLKEIFGSLIIGVVGISGGYMGANAWSKGREDNSIVINQGGQNSAIQDEHEVED